MRKSIFLTIGLVVFFVLGFVYYQQNPASENSVFPSCPTHSILGFYCPGCGTQRAVHYLLHLDVVSAFRYNPIFVIFLPLITILVVQKILRYLGRYWDIKLFRQNWFVYTLFGILVLYFILRNIQLESLVFLRPPDYAI